MGNREKMNQLLKLVNGSSKVLVVINADPDAIGSAMAVKRLLWRKVSEVTITYFNKITRPDNLAMITYTEPGLVPLEQIKKEDFDFFIIVDSQPDHNENFALFEFDVILDHHPLSADKARFSDIRSDYGACSTMMTEYLKSRKIKPSSKLAAALMLGIKTDTSNFTRQTSLRDIRAFQYLYQFADMNIVTKVERAALTQADLNFLGLAIKHRKISNNRVFFHAGKISKPDELVVVADFFLTLARVNWSVISGIYENTLVIVIRNDGLRKGAGNTAKEAFSAFGAAGGHKTMARAELDLKLVRKQTKSVGKKMLGEWIIAMIDKTAGKKIE
ncbi:MAG: DHH family phosphoesterase [Proteobacteria bacterium]|nr:DHH family phosphoesterase [Pseudomonadota bacterium]MBU1389146.1 DHH family phosphoesterase [Pseudomonadota bacterium]MBU1543370.1 DHH family phosphoesterase [Pseudomonadota bacterium]MBU2481458.1 DHH family phosphoesterase [Pseudomonadota bacterium]